jgi:hypothetical protein
MNPLTLLDKTWIHLQLMTWHESTYTAWQNMNPFTVIDMTWIHMLDKKYQSIYTAWKSIWIKLQSLTDIWIHIHCLARHESTYSYWHDIWIHLLDKKYQSIYTAWKSIWIQLQSLTDIWIHIHCLARHTSTYTAWQDIWIHLYYLTRHMNALRLLDKTEEPHLNLLNVTLK